MLRTAVWNRTRTRCILDTRVPYASGAFFMRYTASEVFLMLCIASDAFSMLYIESEVFSIAECFLKNTYGTGHVAYQTPAYRTLRAGHRASPFQKFTKTKLQNTISSGMLSSIAEAP